MNKRLKTTISAVMISAMIMAASCSSEKDKAKEAPISSEDIMSAENLKVNDTMPEELPDGMEWYDYSVIDLPTELLPDDGFSFSRFAVKDDGYCYYATKLNEDTMEPEDIVMLTDRDNNLIKSFEFDNGNDYILGVTCYDNDFWLRGFNYDGQDFYIKITRDSDITKEEKLVLNTDGENVASSYISGDKLIVLYYDVLAVKDLSSGKDIKRFDLKQELSDKHLYSFESCIKCDDDHVILSAITSANNEFSIDRYFVFDFTTKELTPVEDIEWMPKGAGLFSYCNGKCVSVNDNGVYGLDLQSGSSELLVSFNCTNSNRYLLKNSFISWIEEDEIIFSFLDRSLYSYSYIPSFEVFSLKKSDDYPVKGRKVISVASFEPLDFALAEACYRFNENSTSAFVILDDSYCINDTSYWGDGNDNDQKHDIATVANASAVDRLKSDIRSDNGPDIIITNGVNLSVLSDEFLTDLNGYGIGKDDKSLFGNVVDASNINGKMYLVPLKFALEGLFGSEDYLKANGFTFEEYKALVDTVCNGTDPVFDHNLDYSKKGTLAKLISLETDVFYKDGRFDVDNDLFRNILDYCRDLPQKADEVDVNNPEEFLTYEANSNAVVVNRTWKNYSDFTTMKEYEDNIVFAGLPSGNARGGGVDILEAAGITSGAKEKDLCAEFIRYLLSSEIGFFLNSKEALSISRDGLKESCRLINEEQSKWTFPGQKIVWNDSLTDDFLSIIDSAGTLEVRDDNIMMIISEEAQGYLEGQRSFEDVVSVINNRVNLLLSERG